LISTDVHFKTLLVLLRLLRYEGVDISVKNFFIGDDTGMVSTHFLLQEEKMIASAKKISTELMDRIKAEGLTGREC